jgi:DNA primase
VSGLIDEATIGRVREAVDIVEVLSEYVTLKKSGKDFVGLCPFHNEKTPSFSVSPAKQIFKCFGCGEGGNVFTFLMAREHMTFPEAVRYLAQRAGIEIQTQASEGPRQTPGTRSRICDVNRWAAEYFRAQLHAERGAAARQYLQQRQISPQSVRRFGLGYAPGGWENLIGAARAKGIGRNVLLEAGLVTRRAGEAAGGLYDRFRDRLMFPILDAQKRVIGFGGRTLADETPKYLNSPETPVFAKSRCLYGLHAARDRIAGGRAVIVEGYTDCIMAHQHGIGETLATLGTALTEEHARLLSRYCDQVVLVFDSDEAGRKAADRSVEIFLTEPVTVRIAAVPTGKDPCDFLLAAGAEAFGRLLDDAPDALEFKWRLAAQELSGATTIDGRREAVDAFLGTVAAAWTTRSIDTVRRGLLTERLARLLRVPPSDLSARLVRLMRRRRARQAGRPAAEPETLSARRQAECQLLEVLLNAPQYLDRIEAVMQPADYRQERLAKLSAHLYEQIRRTGEVDLAALSTAEGEREFGQTVTDLAVRGEQRGNFEATVAGALEFISDQRRREQYEQERRLGAEEGAEPDDDERLRRLQKQLGTGDRRSPGMKDY